jgi:hypothetical protein
MRITFLMPILVSLILLGCSTSFHEIKPIYPVVADPYRQKGVDSLQPTFRWEPLPELDVTYDLIIYKGIRVKSEWWQGAIWSEEREVYYRQALKEPEHKIEVPLKPDTVYYWTIRARRGETVSEWASYDYVSCGPYVGCIRRNNNHFIFKTP